jgi:hypothetical protein
MKSKTIAATALIGLASSIALAGEMTGGPADIGANTTAPMHCEKMSGAQRSACLGELREGPAAKRGNSDVAVPDRSPGAATRPGNATGATGSATGEISSGRSDIQSGSGKPKP